MVTVKVVLESKSSKQLNTKIKTTVSREPSSTDENINSLDELEASSSEIETSSNEELDLKSEPLKIEQVAEILNSLDTREEGLRILTESCSTKKDLQSLAACIDIPNSKKDSIQTLRDKIIEATIGFRLRSKAIQGEPIETRWLKSNTPEPTQDEVTPTKTEELDAETSQESQTDTIEQTLSE